MLFIGAAICKVKKIRSNKSSNDIPQRFIYIIASLIESRAIGLTFSNYARICILPSVPLLISRRFLFYRYKNSRKGRFARLRELIFHKSESKYKWIVDFYHIIDSSISISMYKRFYIHQACETYIENNWCIIWSRYYNFLVQLIE